MSPHASLPDNLHDLLKTLRDKSGDAVRANASETERLLIATVLKLADELDELRVRLRRVAL